MDTSRNFRWPNLLILAGLVPPILWSLLFALIMSKEHIGYEIYYLAPAGLLAYLLTMAISGAGFLWADRILRDSSAARPLLTMRLVQFVAVVLILPWIALPIIGVVWTAK